MKKHICTADVLFSAKPAFVGINPPAVDEIASR